MPVAAPLIRPAQWSGSGCSADAKQRTDRLSLPFRSGAKVTLYEKDNVFGGHTLTDESGPYPVDLGFQVISLAS